MTKFSFPVIVGLVVLGLTGCKSNATPHGVIGIAVKAVAMDNVKAFRETLSSAAVPRYANSEFMEQLRKKFGQYRLVAGANRLQRVRNDGLLSLSVYETSILRAYSKTQNGFPEVLLRVTTVCLQTSSIGTDGQPKTVSKCEISEVN